MRLIQNLASHSKHWKVILSILFSFYSFALFAQNDFKIQRGVATVSGTNVVLSAPADFTAVSDLTKAFVRITNSQHTGAGRDASGGNQNADDVTAYIQFDSTSQITITRVGTGTANTRVCWEIVEYIGAPGGDNEFIVREQGVHTFAASALTSDEDFPVATNQADIVPFITGVVNPDTGRNDYESGLVTSSVVDADTVRFTRGSAGSDAIQVSYAIVEFTGSNWSVERVSHTYGATGAPERESTTVADISKAFIHVQKRNDTGLGGLDEFGHQVWLSAANEISFQLRSGASSPSGQTSVAWIISNPQMVVTRGNGTIASGGSEPQTNNITITAVPDLTNASVFWNNDCAGTGTAFPRPIHAVRLTSVNNIEMWRSDTGQPQDYRYEVVQWPKPPPVAFHVAGTIYTDEAKTIPVAAGTSVALSMNGATPSSTTTNASGQFSFATVANPDDVVLAYLNASSGVSSYHALYNAATGTNITKGNGNSNLASTNLLDRSDGTDSGADIAINWLVAMSNGSNTTDKDPDAGTDAYGVFNGNIDLSSDYAYTNVADGTDFGTITFSNLDTNKKYTVALYHNRDTGADRITRYTIAGIDSATQASTSGVTVISPTSVEYDADNTTDGYVARWTDIDPNGTDFTITLTKAGGGYAYPPQAIMLKEQPPPGSSGSLVTVTDGVTDMTGANQLILVTDKIILEHQTGSSITNAQLDVIDGVAPNDEDGITIAGGNATFASDRELWVSAGKNYVPGGDVTLSDIKIFGTLTGGTNTFTINGSWNNAGSFAAGTSTVLFAGGATANITGNTIFHNFKCLTPNKNLVFEQGSTQTISGLFRLEGDRSSSTRVILASSGGAGTNWDLVINGDHDCNYVNVQGSTVSGTAYLPINPAGYFNNGGNTNWYASSLPDDVIFYDNFDNSTLGSASPDRESSNWSVPSWSDGPDVTVNTRNHTPGGSQSMYSAGGTANNGDASWNSPAWGPVDNGVAECWFYDDMIDGGGKRIWASVESSTGQEWAAIGISTVDSASKYAFHLGSGGSPLATQVTFIDRSVGWHKATWIRDLNYITLYLDDIQIYQGPNSQLDNFADFDLGSWGYDNPNGSTAMYFDDCVVYRSQHQSAYRWYENDDIQNPTPIDAENTAITREINTTTRVRIQLQNDMAMDWGVNPTYVGLQYRQGASGNWVDLGAGAHWEYVAIATDGTQIANALLTNTNIREHFVSSQPSTRIISSSPSEYPEWDFTIQANANASIGSDYFFRMVVTDASGAYLKTFAAYPFLPECQIISPTMWVWTGNASNDWDDPANWNQSTIPDATSDVIIQTGANRDPRINISGAVCKSLFVQKDMTLLLDTASTDLTVLNNATINGTVTHSNDTAVFNLNAGELLIDGGTYNHTGNGALNAVNADLRILSNGVYNFDSQATVTVKNLYVDNMGTFSDSVADGVLNVGDFNIMANSQFLSDRIGTNYNISGNFVNDGSMLGSTGGVFNFTGTAKTYSGSAVKHNLYQANFTGSYTITTTSDITVLDDLTIGASGSLTAGTGTLFVAGNWTNSGTFTHGSGTVDFNGTGLQNITSGASDWNNLVQTNASAAGVSFLDGFTTSTLTNSTAGSTMTFHAGDTYAINAVGGLQLAGAAGNEITLASSSPGTFWEIDPVGGSWSVDYVNVADSVNLSETTIFPTNSTNSGHNINWFSSDQDKDHLPDYWEYKYYHGLANPLINNAKSDTDNDDLSAIEEYALDTNPTIPNINPGDKLFVDDNAGYIGDGTVGAPFKYLEDALDAATDGTLISLAEGTYELDDYALSKRVLIRGEEGPFKTIIRGATPDGGTSNLGQMLNVSGKNFMLSKVTLRLFRDDKPIISYDGDNTTKIVIFNNLIFRDNNTQTKSLIAPSTTKQPFKVYMLNCLVYSNSALSAGELGASKAMYAFNNTIVNNTFTSTIIIESEKDSWLTNCILRNSNTEITDNGDGNLYVSNCNVEGTIPATAITVGNYDSVETFADSATGAYQLLPGSPGVDLGLTTELTWDINNNPRPQGSAYDVGAYELDPNDSDGDGLTDDYENNHPGLNQDNPDSDGDGLTDGEEVSKYGTDPTLRNTDGDFIDDGDELAMGMDPLVPDGDGDIDGVYYTSFENETQFPTGAQMVDTIWGHNGNANNSGVIVGQVTIENIGAAAYDGAKVAKCAGQIPESSYIGWVDRNSLDNYWISIAWKMPRAKLPTDINEAFNIAGAFLAIDENGYLNIYYPKVDPPDPSPAVPPETWIKDTVVIPENTWITVTVHRDHPGKTVDVWLDISGSRHQAFAGVPISGPDPTAGTGKFRMSMSSVGEKDVFTDLWSALPFAPF